MKNKDIISLNYRFADKDPREIMLWAWDTFGLGAATTSSFPSQSLPLLHMVSITTPMMPVVFLDTGFHFPETLNFRDEIVKALKLNLIVIKPKLDQMGHRRRDGELYHTDPDLCCFINKVKPLECFLEGHKAWITGIRSDQTPERKNTPLVELSKNKLLKISPLNGWTNQKIWQYIEDHQLPTHPLLSKGYMSIGCAPCTRPVFDNDDERAGRWPGFSKNECGIHITIDEDEFS